MISDQQTATNVSKTETIMIDHTAMNLPVLHYWRPVTDILRTGGPAASLVENSADGARRPSAGQSGRGQVVCAGHDQVALYNTNNKRGSMRPGQLMPYLHG